MSRDCFNFMWRYFKIDKPIEDDYAAEEDIDIDGDEGNLVEVNLERIFKTKRTKQKTTAMTILIKQKKSNNKIEMRHKKCWVLQDQSPSGQRSGGK